MTKPETTKQFPSGMVQSLKTGAFVIPLTKADKQQMAVKNIHAMGADKNGHFAIYRVVSSRIVKGKKRSYTKIVEHPERFNTPSEAIAAVK